MGDAGALVTYRAEGTHNLGNDLHDIEEGVTPPQTVNFGDFSFR